MRGAKQTALTVVLLVTACSGTQAQSHIPWQSNWQEAASLAQRYQRLVLIHFSSQDCAPCVKLERTVLSRPEVIRAVVSNYVPLKVDVDENPELPQRYRVAQWPTDIILTAQGDELYRATSPQDANRYIATLDQVAAHARVSMPIGASPSTELVAGPSNSDVNRYGSQFPLGASGGTPAAGIGGNSPTAATAGTAAASGGAWSPTGSPSQYGGQGGVQYVSNQFATSPTSGGHVAAEQQASYNVSQESQFPLPTQTPPPATRPAPQQSAYAASQQNSYVAQQNTYVPQASNYGAQSSTYGTQPSTYGTQPSTYGAQSNAYGGQSSAATAQQNGVTVEQNTFVPPSQGALGAPIASVALGNPAPAASRSPVIPDPQGPPTLGLDGFCCVALVEREQWVKGDPQWGIIHRGRTYLFSGPEEKQRFWANFDKYAPVLSGYDCVQYAERGVLVDGRRAHGIFYRGQIFLFADEASLQQFWNAPERYMPIVRAEQERHATRR